MAIAQSQATQSQIGSATSLKQEVVQALESLSAEQLQQVLAYAQQLQPQESKNESEQKLDAVPENCRSEVWAAYLASEKEYAEVYRRLADS
ncbi:MAG: hypothetical protein ACPGVO_01550 [Spirulinaceae cyanobacterium]